MTAEMKTINLVKGRERFTYTYEVGQEVKLLDAVVADVNRGLLDWFDATVLSHQLGQHFAEELKPYLPKNFIP